MERPWPFPCGRCGREMSPDGNYGPDVHIRNLIHQSWRHGREDLADQLISYVRGYVDGSAHRDL